jgi:hypothetical protein
MEYKVRYTKLCRQLDQQLCELDQLNENPRYIRLNAPTKSDDFKKRQEKNLLDAMEKALKEGNLRDAMRYQFMLEILG